VDEKKSILSDTSTVISQFISLTHSPLNEIAFVSAAAAVFKKIFFFYK
jgi:hypothetical protein